jgi:hypothetical protein
LAGVVIQGRKNHITGRNHGSDQTVSAHIFIYFNTLIKTCQYGFSMHDGYPDQGPYQNLRGHPFPHPVESCDMEIMWKELDGAVSTVSWRKFPLRTYHGPKVRYLLFGMVFFHPISAFFLCLIEGLVGALYQVHGRLINGAPIRGNTRTHPYLKLR